MTRDHPRVVIVSATPIDGEWATSQLMTSLFAGWPKDRLSQVVLARDGVAAASQPIRTLTVALDGNRNPVSVAQQMRAATNFCRDVGADVVYFRSAGWPLAFEALPLWLTRRTDLRLVTHLMDDWPARLARTRPAVAKAAVRLLHLTLRASHECLAISPAMADHFEAATGRSFRVAHNGVEVGGVAAAGGEIDTNAGIFTPSDPQRILYSGSAATDQSAAALDDAVRATELLVERGHRVQLDLALSPRHADDMRRRIAGSTAVRVLDHVDRGEYLQRLRSADVLLLAFNFDPTSVALLRRSMANKVGDYLGARRPIVVYGPKELATVDAARSGGWAHVVDRHGANRLADGLAAALSDAELQHTLLRRSDDAAKSTFDLRVHRATLETAVRTAAARPLD